MPDVNMAAQLSTRRVRYLLELSDKVDPAVVDEFYPTAGDCEKANGSAHLPAQRLAHFCCGIGNNAPAISSGAWSEPADDRGGARTGRWQEYEAVGAAAAANDSGIVVGASSIHMTLMNYLMSNGCNVAIPLAAGSLPTGPSRQTNACTTTGGPKASRCRRCRSAWDVDQDAAAAANDPGVFIHWRIT